MTTSAYKVEEVDIDPEAPCACGGGCGWTGKASQAADIGECALTAGDPSPVGRCPVCDDLTYVDRTPGVTGVDAKSSLLRELAETLGALHQFARNEQAKDRKRHLLSPEADTHIAALIAEGLRQANAAECDVTGVWQPSKAPSTRPLLVGGTTFS